MPRFGWWILPGEGKCSRPASGRCAPWLLPAGRKGLTEIGISGTLSTMEHGKVEIGAAILPRISREFGRALNGRGDYDSASRVKVERVHQSVDWILPGEGK